MIKSNQTKLMVVGSFSVTMYGDFGGCRNNLFNDTSSDGILMEFRTELGLSDELFLCSFVSNFRIESCNKREVLLLSPRGEKLICTMMSLLQEFT
jgi:hypothetical protein